MLTNKIQGEAIDPMMR